MRVSTGDLPGPHYQSVSCWNMSKVQTLSFGHVYRSVYCFSFFQLVQWAQTFSEPSIERRSQVVLSPSQKAEATNENMIIAEAHGRNCKLRPGTVYEARLYENQNSMHLEPHENRGKPRKNMQNGGKPWKTLRHLASSLLTSLSCLLDGEGLSDDVLE